MISMDITLADKTHVEAWDGDETSQNAPDDETVSYTHLTLQTNREV